MSINDFFNKIKGKLNIDTYIILYLLLVILVGISSFFLGRLSLESNNMSLNNSGNIRIINRGVYNDDYVLPKKEYVASRNGKIYYPLNCTKANNILNKNKIWFTNSGEAQEAGYKPSSTCN